MSTMTKTYPLLTELELFNLKENAEVNPALFTGSFGEKAAIVTIPLGVDLRLCRGVKLLIGVSPNRELTFELEEDWDSPNRPGMVDIQDKMSVGPTRRVQILRPAIILSGGLKSLSEVPQFGRTRPGKILVKRDRNLLLTFTNIIIPKTA